MDLLRRVGATNQKVSETYYIAKQAQGVSNSTLIGVMGALEKLDRLSEQTPFDEITPEQLTRIVAQFAEGKSDFTTRTLTKHWAAFYAWRNDGECPKQIKRAFHRKAPRPTRTIVPITQQEFDAMLQGMERDCVNEAPDRYARRRAILWTLWDSGFRISELLALRIESFRPDADSKGARLVLPPNAPDLKTGPRSIYVVECVGPIRAWLALHPQRNDPKAALFPAFSKRNDRMWPHSIDRLLETTCHRGGIRKVNPHLFRHTRATRAAETGWNEAELRAYFGWESTSRMAAHYVHLAQAHMDQRIREDAKMDPLGSRIREDPKLAMAELAAAIVTRTLDEVEARKRTKRDDDNGAAAPLART